MGSSDKIDMPFLVRAALRESLEPRKAKMANVCNYFRIRELAASNIYKTAHFRTKSLAQKQSCFIIMIIEFNIRYSDSRSVR
jgi:hypothetical protein